MKNKRKFSRKKPECKQNRSTLLFIGICFLIAVAVIIFNHLPQSPQPLPDQLVKSEYSQGEMDDMWTNHFQADVEKLFANKYPLSNIQARFNLQCKHVDQRYHQTNVNINLGNGYMPEGESVLAGSWVTDGKPQLSIIVPKLIDVYKSEQQKKPSRV